MNIVAMVMSANMSAVANTQQVDRTLAIHFIYIEVTIYSNLPLCHPNGSPPGRKTIVSHFKL